MKLRQSFQIEQFGDLMKVSTGQAEIRCQIMPN